MMIYLGFALQYSGRNVYVWEGVWMKLRVTGLLTIEAE